MITAFVVSPASADFKVAAILLCAEGGDRGAHGGQAVTQLYVADTVSRPSSAAAHD